MLCLLKRRCAQSRWKPNKPALPAKANRPSVTTVVFALGWRCCKQRSTDPVKPAASLFADKSILQHDSRGEDWSNSALPTDTLTRLSAHLSANCHVATPSRRPVTVDQGTFSRNTFFAHNAHHFPGRLFRKSANFCTLCNIYNISPIWLIIGKCHCVKTSLLKQ